MNEISVSADDVFAVMASEHSDLLKRFARSEARRLYLEDRVEKLEKIISEQDRS